MSCENGYKYHSDNENIERLRAESDKLCLQYGLSVLPPKKQSQKVKQMSSREYRAAECGESWKMQLIVTIEDAMAIARSREHFIRLMEAEGYEVNWKALIAAMNTQIDMLSAIQKSLTEYAESCRELTEQFTAMMERTAAVWI